MGSQKIEMLLITCWRNPRSIWPGPRRTGVIWVTRGWNAGFSKVRTAKAESLQRTLQGWRPSVTRGSWHAAAERAQLEVKVGRSLGARKWKG